jgi:hypothetical protein
MIIIWTHDKVDANGPGIATVADLRAASLSTVIKAKAGH